MMLFRDDIFLSFCDSTLTFRIFIETRSGHLILYHGGNWTEPKMPGLAEIIGASAM